MAKVKTGCILRYSPLSGSVYAITRWTEHENHLIAHKKYDVTEDFRELQRQRVKIHPKERA